MSDLSPPVVHGKLMGMDITTRLPYNGRDGTVHKMAPIITMVIEDDEAWHRKNFKFDAGWLDDLILCAQLAKEHIKRTE
ncbi:MAG: hypothetical protein RR877_10360 [Aurantimicrobium sp.]|uniref:hypothetical protein n=1 Tax=Aurantimicrobium sp. TaxID=1930784 RepID=UPI002FC6629E